MKSIALVGGMRRLEHHYKEEATRVGVRLEVINSIQTRMVHRISGAHAVAIFIGQVSHKLREVVIKAAQSNGIPVLFCHSCGVCALRECLSRCLENREKCFLRERVRNWNANGGSTNGSEKENDF